MQVKVQEKIRRDPKLASVVDGATKVLEGEVTSSADRATAEWSLSQDEQNRPLVELRLSDFEGSVARRFSLDELTNTSYLQGRLNRLWDDLLAVRLDKQLARLRQSVQKLEEED